MKQEKTPHLILVLGVLGLLTALATVVNNMYSPVMPAIASHFGSSHTSVQLGLTASLAGLAIGQIVIGLLSDRYGRRLPLLLSMGTYVAVSVALACVTSLQTLIALRVLQGIAAGGGIVISRSIATDMRRGNQLLKMLAVINVINGLMPIITPIIGGSLGTACGWRAVIWVMAAVGTLLLLGCLFLSETLPTEQRSALDATSAARLFGKVLKNKEFIYPTLHQGGALAVLFCNIAATPFLLTHYGLGPGTIGLALGANGIFTALGAGMAPTLGNSLRGIKVTGWGLAVLAVVQAVVLISDAGIWPYEVVTSMMLFFVGITLTSSSSHAMDSARREAGTASAVLGAVGFIIGAVVPPLTSSGNMLYSTAAVYGAGAACALFFALLTARVKKS